LVEHTNSCHRWWTIDLGIEGRAKVERGTVGQTDPDSSTGQIKEGNTAARSMKKERRNK